MQRRGSKGDLLARASRDTTARELAPPGEEYYANCRALIFPQEEDLGIAPLEAMASGKPVIAYRTGGALETVKEMETGLFFNKQNSKSLIEELIKFKESKFNPEKIRKYAQNFDKEIFKQKIYAELTSK
ncbi:MAG: glycosyltransferase [Parcubacteria group bacterium]|nr:glycosyltransferase [Parcubacteria group bacterium]